MLHNIDLGPLTAQVSQWPLDPSQPTLAFIHGAGFHGGFWHPQKSLIDQFNLIFLNLPGRRTAPKSEGTVEAYADKVQEALNQLDIPLVLIGHSMGGAVAQMLMVRKPKWLLAGVLACTGAKLKVAPVVNQLLAQGASVFMQMFSQMGPSLDTEQTRILGKQLAQTQTGMADFLACNRFDFMDSLAKIHLPCLIVTGDRDLLTPEKFSQYLHQHIKGSELALVKDAGHLLPWESTSTFNQLISEFAHRHEPHSVSATD